MQMGDDHFHIQKRNTTSVIITVGLACLKSNMWYFIQSWTYRTEIISNRWMQTKMEFLKLIGPLGSKWGVMYINVREENKRWMFKESYCSIVITSEAKNGKSSIQQVITMDNDRVLRSIENIEKLKKRVLNK